MNRLNIILLLSTLAFLSCNWSNEQDGYEGDLIPIKTEVEKMADYEKIAVLALKNKIQLDTQPDVHYPRQTPELFTPHTLKDSIFSYIVDTLNLRFFYYHVEIQNKDTVVVFEPPYGDYYMRNNKKDEDACCTLFEHQIIYSSRHLEEVKIKDNEDDTPYAVIKLKDKMYYTIYSRLVY